MPHILNIEPGNICNLSCPLCPTGSNDPSLKKGMCSFKLFQKVFDQLNGQLECVNLYSWGEPLLNIELGEIIRYIKGSKRPVKVITSTNLNIKDRRALDDFIASGIDEVIVSCDGATKESYVKYRIGGNFGQGYPYLHINHKLKSFLRENRILFIDTLDLFKESSYSPLELSISFSNRHKNAKANSLIADYVFSVLIKNKVIRCN